MPVPKIYLIYEIILDGHLYLTQVGRIYSNLNGAGPLG